MASEQHVGSMADQCIAQMLADLTDLQKEQVARQMLSSKYVRQILDIFRVSSAAHPLLPRAAAWSGARIKFTATTERRLGCVQSCEDLEDTESLRHLFEIIKGTIMLCDTGIMEALFAEDNVMDTVSCCCHPLHHRTHWPAKTDE